MNVPIKDLSTKAKVQLAKTSDDMEVLQALVKDKNAYVKQALAKNPNVTEEMLAEANSLKNLSVSSRVNLVKRTEDMDLLETIASTDTNSDVLQAVVDRVGFEEFNVSDHILEIIITRALNDSKLQRVNTINGWTTASVVLDWLRLYGLHGDSHKSYSPRILKLCDSAIEQLNERDKDIYINENGYYVRPK